jgi:Kef-type K+ transport system membrane component KefB
MINPNSKCNTFHVNAWFEVLMYTFLLILYFFLNPFFFWIKFYSVPHIFILKSLFSGFPSCTLMDLISVSVQLKYSRTSL